MMLDVNHWTMFSCPETDEQGPPVFNRVCRPHDSEIPQH